jgi:hypothetical protein
MGIGAFNEVFEFVAAAFLGASDNVGSYANNALDLVFNLVGSITASIYLMYYHGKKNIP